MILKFISENFKFDFSIKYYSRIDFIKILKVESCTKKIILYFNLHAIMLDKFDHVIRSF